VFQYNCVSHSFNIVNFHVLTSMDHTFLALLIDAVLRIVFSYALIKCFQILLFKLLHVYIFIYLCSNELLNFLFKYCTVNFRC